MTARFLCLSVVVLFATLSGGAQEQPETPTIRIRVSA